MADLDRLDRLQKQREELRTAALRFGAIIYSIKPEDNDAASYGDWSDFVWAIFKAMQASEKMNRNAALFLDTAMTGVTNAR
jgi:hypothetical protein